MMAATRSSQLRIPFETAGKYLADYARMYLPVDQFKCEAAYGNKCESSGRKLVTVLSRDHGDSFNLVFLYRYESDYKEDYYCKYPKAFLLYHKAHPMMMPGTEEAKYNQATRDTNGKKETKGGVDTTDMEQPVTLDDLFETVRAKRAEEDYVSLENTLKNLPTKCSDRPITDDAKKALDMAKAVVHEADLILLMQMQAEETSWNFDVNLCKVNAMTDTPKIKKADLDTGCSDFQYSLLERALKLDWQKAWRDQ